MAHSTISHVRLVVHCSKLKAQANIQNLQLTRFQVDINIYVHLEFSPRRKFAQIHQIYFNPAPLKNNFEHKLFASKTIRHCQGDGELGGVVLMVLSRPSISLTRPCCREPKKIGPVANSSSL